MIVFNIDRQTALDLHFIEAISSQVGRTLTFEEAKEAHSQLRMEEEDRRKNEMNDKFFSYMKKTEKVK